MWEGDGGFPTVSLPRNCPLLPIRERGLGVRGEGRDFAVWGICAKMLVIPPRSG